MNHDTQIPLHRKQDHTQNKRKVILNAILLLYLVLLSARIMMIDTYTQKAQVFCGYVSWPKMRKKDEKLPTAKCCTDCNLWASLLPVLLQKPRSIYEKIVDQQWLPSDLLTGLKLVTYKLECTSTFLCKTFQICVSFQKKLHLRTLEDTMCFKKKSSIFFNPSLLSIDPGRLTAWTWE